MTLISERIYFYTEYSKYYVDRSTNKQTATIPWRGYGAGGPAQISYDATSYAVGSHALSVPRRAFRRLLILGEQLVEDLVTLLLRLEHGSTPFSARRGVTGSSCAS